MCHYSLEVSFEAHIVRGILHDVEYNVTLDPFRHHSLVGSSIGQVCYGDLNPLTLWLSGDFAVGLR